MRQFGNRQRTRADRTRDFLMWLNTAAPHKILAATAPELAQRYGTDARETADALRVAQERVG